MASNIDNTVPAVDAALISEPIRNNFIAAKSEIEALQGVAVTNGDSHDHSGGDGAQIAYANLSGLPTLGTAAATAATDYAPAAKGVTNGDSHDHNGGDGAQIAYANLSGLPTLGTAAATASTAYAPAAQGVTNGNSHDHSGGDGAQIAYANLSGLPTLSTYAPLASPALTGNPTAPTATQGDSDTSIATTAFVNAEIAADAVPISFLSTPIGMRNSLINGGFDVWQRGTSFASGASKYSADRWSFNRNGLGANITVSRQTGEDARYCLRVQRTAADTLKTSVAIIQIVESANMRDLAGKTVTLTFRARKGADFSSSVLTSYIRTGTAEDEGVPSATNLWTGLVSRTQGNELTTSFQTCTHTATLGADVRELCIIFVHTPTGTAGAADYYEIEQVQLEAGAIATPFERRPVALELALCQRYYYRISADAFDILAPSGHVISTTQARVITPFPVHMRIAPTALEQTGTAGDYRFIFTGTSVVICSSVPSFVRASPDNATSLLTYATGGLTVDNFTYCSAVNSGAYLGFSAEL